MTTHIPSGGPGVDRMVRSVAEPQIRMGKYMVTNSTTDSETTVCDTIGHHFLPHTYLRFRSAT